MITVEIKEKTDQDEDGDTYVSKYVVVNGIPDEDSHYFESEKSELLRHFVRLENKEVIKIFLDHSFKEIGNRFTEFSFTDEIPNWNDDFKIAIYCNEYFDEKIPKILIELTIPNWEDWANPWSMSTLAKEFEGNVLKLNSPQIRYYEEDSESMLNGFGLEYFPDSLRFENKKRTRFHFI